MADNAAATGVEAMNLVSTTHLNKRFRYRFIDGDRMVEVDAILATVDGWKDRKESSSPLWLSKTLGNLVLAIRFPNGA